MTASNLDRFLDRQLAQRMPRSYKRFLWFLLTLSLSLLALVIGQGFATIYLSTLPHSNIDGLVYVWSWILTVQCLNAVSNWILNQKVRSQALVFIFRVRMPLAERLFRFTNCRAFFTRSFTTSLHILSFIAIFLLVYDHRTVSTLAPSLLIPKEGDQCHVTTSQRL